MHISAGELVADVFGGSFEAAADAGCVAVLAGVVAVDADGHQRRPRRFGDAAGSDVGAEAGEFISVDDRVAGRIAAGAVSAVDGGEDAGFLGEVVGWSIGAKGSFDGTVDHDLDGGHIGRVEVVEDAPQGGEDFVDAFANGAVALEAGGPVDDGRRESPQDDIGRIPITVVQRDDLLGESGFVSVFDLVGEVGVVGVAGDVVGERGQDGCVRNWSHGFHMRPGSYCWTYRPDDRRCGGDGGGYRRSYRLWLRRRFGVGGSYRSTYRRSSHEGKRGVGGATRIEVPTRSSSACSPCSAVRSRSCGPEQSSRPSRRAEAF